MVNVNNIKTVNDLLNAIKNKGVVNIEHYLNIKHNPTIGNMYEGLTKEIISRALFEGLNIKVVSGKITNKEKSIVIKLTAWLYLAKEKKYHTLKIIFMILIKLSW